MCKIKQSRKWLSLVVSMAMVLSIGVFLTGCGNSAESQIEEKVEATLDDVASGGKALTDNISFDSLNKVGVETDTFLEAYLKDFDYTIEVGKIGEEAKEATATVTVTMKKYGIFGDNLNLEADEMVAAKDFLDLTKKKRYEKAVNDVTNAIDATTPEEIKIEFQFAKEKEEWVPSEDVTVSVINGLFPEEDVEKVDAAVYRYIWKYDGMTAGEVVAEMKKAGLAIGEIQNYDENTDPNGLLGRPNQYIEKTTFRDNRISDPYDLAYYDDGTLDNDFGGTLEVFDSIKDRKTRQEYIESVTSTTGLGATYTYARANMLLRMSFDLTPSEAVEYEKEFLQMD
ncbi:MAG: hypothetical protein Q4B70_18340 [Lachnospiraceae bacterium]|nr:hypothetical protein [Lachnospiraceae bacterium]